MFFKKRKKLKQIEELKVLILSKQNEIDLLNRDLVWYREELKNTKQMWNYNDIEKQIKRVSKKRDILKRDRNKLKKELKVLEG